MKLEAILPKMTRFYLTRTANSLINSVKAKDDEHLREIILQNKKHLFDELRIKDKINFFAGLPRNIAILNDIIMDIILQQHDYSITEGKLLEEIKQYEEGILNDAKDEKILANCNDDYLDIYTTVLKAAWANDGQISSHEAHMLQVLQERLGFTKYEHRILEARLKKFPHSGNKMNSMTDIDESLKDLQNRGLVLRVKEQDVYYVVPEEMAFLLRKLCGIELRLDAYNLLLESLNVSQLQKILATNKLFVSGKKEDLCSRIISARIKPSQAICSFTSDELSLICKGLEGVKVSGTKEEKIDNIISYYNKLITKKPEDPVDERSIYYEYLGELAARKHDQLRGNKIINKDLEIERYFELATQYLFEKKLGQKLVVMSGLNHADGKLVCGNEVILWDNKSCEKEYEFPEAHFEQFKGYIKNEEKKVTLFLVIAPSYTSDAEDKAHKLKAITGGDTDIGLITADELKYLVTTWHKLNTGKNNFDLRVLDHTGRLTKQVIDQRLKWFI